MGSPEAERRFRALVPPLLDDAYSLAKWLTGSAADAEDVVQDAAIRALGALERTAVETPRAWFLAIVRNAALTFLARRGRDALTFSGGLAQLEAVGDETAPDAEALMIALQDGERVRRAIAALPLPLREALVLREVDGLTYREIAVAIDAPIGTVMSRLSRARSQLQSLLRSPS